MNANRSIAYQLKSAETAVNNALADEIIAERMAGYGYTKVGLKKGLALQVAASEKVDDATAATGAGRASTRALREALGEVRESYQEVAAVMRAALAGRLAELSALHLGEKCPRRAPDLVLKARQLFNNEGRSSALRTVLAGRGFDDTRLVERMVKVEAWDAAFSTQALLCGDANVLKAEQRDAMKELRQWHAAFIKVARVALRLVKLGVTVRASRSDAQRLGRLKASETRRRNREKREPAVRSEVA